MVPVPAAMERGELRILVTEETDPGANLALEDALLREVDAGARPDTLRLWIDDECIVRGRRRSRLCGWHEEDLAWELGVRVYARSTGGGSVYHDRGNVNWSFYLRRAEGYLGSTELFRRCSGVIVAALRALGVDATFSPPNRIDVAGRKVSGMAARAALRASLVHGTLLVSTDIDRLNALCIPPPGCPPVTRLCDLDPRLTVAEVVRGIAGIAAETHNGAG